MPKFKDSKISQLAWASFSIETFPCVRIINSGKRLEYKCGAMLRGDNITLYPLNLGSDEIVFSRENGEIVFGGDRFDIIIRLAAREKVYDYFGDSKVGKTLDELVYGSTSFNPIFSPEKVKKLNEIGLNEKKEKTG